MKQEWQKSPAETRQTDGKSLVWFGEIERKLAKLSKTTLLTVLPLNYFMVQRKIAVAVQNVKPLYFLSRSFALSHKNLLSYSICFNNQIN